MGNKPGKQGGDQKKQTDGSLLSVSGASISQPGGGAAAPTSGDQPVLPGELKAVRKHNKKINRKHPEFELTYDMMLGIRTTVSRIESKPWRKLTKADFEETSKLQFPSAGSSTTPAHHMRDFKFKDYSPQVFRQIRARFRIEPADYLLCVCGNFKYLEFISNSKSGQFFFYSHDRKYMIKTVSAAECKFLREILPSYYQHIMENPNTLMTRFYGMHRVKPHKKKEVHFLIMGSVFYTVRYINMTFDLKGSKQGRNASEKEKKSGNCVFKDNDLLEMKFKLQLGPERAKLLNEQIARDVELLTKLNIMDYSLLLGVHQTDVEAPAHHHHQQRQIAAAAAEQQQLLLQQQQQQQQQQHQPSQPQTQPAAQTSSPSRGGAVTFERSRAFMGAQAPATPMGLLEGPKKTEMTSTTATGKQQKKTKRKQKKKKKPQHLVVVIDPAILRQQAEGKADAGALLLQSATSASASSRRPESFEDADDESSSSSSSSDEETGGAAASETDDEVDAKTPHSTVRFATQPATTIPPSASAPKPAAAANDSDGESETDSESEAEHRREEQERLERERKAAVAAARQAEREAAIARLAPTTDADAATTMTTLTIHAAAAGGGGGAAAAEPAESEEESTTSDEEHFRQQARRSKKSSRQPHKGMESPVSPPSPRSAARETTTTTSSSTRPAEQTPPPAPVRGGSDPGSLSPRQIRASIDEMKENNTEEFSTTSMPAAPMESFRRGSHQRTLSDLTGSPPATVERLGAEPKVEVVGGTWDVNRQHETTRQTVYGLPKRWNIFSSPKETNFVAPDFGPVDLPHQQQQHATGRTSAPAALTVPVPAAAAASASSSTSGAAAAATAAVLTLPPVHPEGKATATTSAVVAAGSSSKPAASSSSSSGQSGAAAATSTATATATASSSSSSAAAATSTATSTQPQPLSSSSSSSSTPAVVAVSPVALQSTTVDPLLHAPEVVASTSTTAPAPAPVVTTTTTTSTTTVSAARAAGDSKATRAASDYQANSVVEAVTSVFTSDDGGFRSVDADGTPGQQIFYMGIIDILTQYTVSKRLEHWGKSFKYDANEISAVAPDQYAKRFRKFMANIIQ